MPFVSIALLCLLLLSPGASAQGAAKGLNLWFTVVLPAIAPFMICTQFIMATGGIRLLTRPFAPLFRRFLGLSEEGTFVMICGLLCGYPVGARLCAEARRRNLISVTEGNYLFAICNYPSPMFLTGYICGMLTLPVHTAFFLLCFYLPVPIISFLSAKKYHFAGANKVHPYTGGVPNGKTQSPENLSDILVSVSETMIMIGNYMMLCSILSSWIARIPHLPAKAAALLAGIVEITTGSERIAIVFPVKEAIPLIIGAVSFGGISGILQTKSVVENEASYNMKNAGLSIRHYVVFKLLHASLAMLCWIITASLLSHW